MRITLGILAALSAGAAAVADAPEPRELVEAARTKYAGIDSYIARLTRRESPGGKVRPEEVILLKFREKPWSAYMKWVGEEGRGREGIYVKGRHGDKVHTRLAAGDVLLLPAGSRMALDPNGALIRSASPHPITDLGIGASIDKLTEAVSATERGSKARGTLAVVGRVGRREFAEPAYGIEHTLPPGVDRSMPTGGRRTYYFDPATGLPLVFLARDEAGRDLEYYRYDRLQPSVKLGDEDFDPDALWGPRDATKRGGP